MKTPITRRKALIGFVTTGIAAIASVIALRIPSTSTKSKHRKVVWVKLKDEPVGPGDMWASSDPNHPERGGAEWGFSFSMQSVRPDKYGIPANQVGHFNGSYWRPVGLVNC